jgi:glycopeptide antibiotics resistance protein
MLQAVVIPVFTFPFYMAFLIFCVVKKIPLIKHIIYFLFYIYLVGVLSLTFFPLPIQKELIKEMRTENYFRNNFIPFLDLYNMINMKLHTVPIRQIGGNLILLLPLGYFLPVIFKRISNFKKVLLICFICSLGIELMQYCISSILGFTYKISDINDVILNTTGAILGYLIFKFLSPYIEKYVNTPSPQ